MRDNGDVLVADRAGRVIQFDEQSPKSSFVIPHVLETSGRALSSPRCLFTFDTTIFAEYNPGVIACDGTDGVPVYKFEVAVPPATTPTAETPAATPTPGPPGTGVAAVSPTPSPTPIASKAIPRSEVVKKLRKAARKAAKKAAKAGARCSPELRVGAAYITVCSDPDGVPMLTFVVNSITGPLQVSVFGFDPQPIAAAAKVGARKKVKEVKVESLSYRRFSFSPPKSVLKELDKMAVERKSGRVRVRYPLQVQVRGGGIRMSRQQLTTFFERGDKPNQGD